MNGVVLVTMKSSDDWKELGVTKFGDLRILTAKSGSLHGKLYLSIITFTDTICGPIAGSKAPMEASNSHGTSAFKAPTTSTDHSPTISVPHSRVEQQALDGLDAVRYKGVIKLVEGYRPPLSCFEHILRDLPKVFNLKDIEHIAKECVTVAESCLQHLPAGFPRLTLDQAISIAAYSFDLGFNDSSENLYYVLNEVLRERSPQKMKPLQPFLAYLMSGLGALPSVNATVFRGVPVSAMDIIKRNYVQGVEIHWSAFTSTTTNLKKARQFGQGKEGIIMRIDVLTGRSIKHYSSIASEDEILLSPNSRLVVVKTVHLEADGYHYVDMVERNEGKSFIF